MKEGRGPGIHCLHMHAIFVTLAITCIHTSWEDRKSTPNPKIDVHGHCTERSMEFPQNPGIILCMHKQCIPGLSLLLWEWPGGEARVLHTPQVPIHAPLYSRPCTQARRPLAKPKIWKEVCLTYDSPIRRRPVFLLTFICLEWYQALARSGVFLSLILSIIAYTDRACRGSLRFWVLVVCIC